MNSALFNIRGPAQAKNAASADPALRRAAALAKQLGESEEMQEQAKTLWSMLDDMAANNPEGYREFIESQERAAKEADMKGRTFTPTSGFVLKATMGAEVQGTGIKIKTLVDDDGTGRNKVFINVCGFEGVEVPKTASGLPADKLDCPTASSLQIPLLVGDPRPVKDHEGQDCHVLDVVLHPWAVAQSQQHKGFMAQVVELVRVWVMKEKGLNLKRGVKVIKSKYKGGTGPEGAQPVPFPVEEAMLQSTPVEDRDHAPTQPQTSHREADKKIADLEDPKLLLKQLRKDDEAQGDEGLVVPQTVGSRAAPPPSTSSEQSTTRTTLVQELGPDGSFVAPDPLPSSDKSTATRADKPMAQHRPSKPLIHKGFLSKNTDSMMLYPEGQSTEGQKEGAYSRLLSRSKVVDTTTMSKEEVDQLMRSHAGAGPTTGGGRGSPSSSSCAEGSGQGLSFQGMKAGFLQGQSGSGLYDGSDKKRSSCDSFDKEFEELMSGIDPDLVRNQPGIHNEEQDEAMAELARLAGALGSLPNGSSALGQALSGLMGATSPAVPATPPLPPPPTTRSEKENKADENVPARRLTGGAAHTSGPQVAFEVEEDSPHTLLVSAKLAGWDLATLKIADVNLDVGRRVVSLILPGGARGAFPLPSPVDPTTAKAAFKKKAGKIQLTLTKAVT